MSHTPLSPEREAEAQQLLLTLRSALDSELLDIARTLVATDESSLFGQTEFDIRDILLKAGSKAYHSFLSQKKTATVAPR
jgi:hypothetical protein